jgi:hypothetical protein
MRSELVYFAGMKVSNRYLLSTLTMKEVRRLHATNARIEETTNQVFSSVAKGDYSAHDAAGEVNSAYAK